MKCAKCGKDVRAGYNAVYVNKKELQCDDCAGVRRDRHGFAWTESEIRFGQVRQNVNPGKVYRVTWDEAK